MTEEERQEFERLKQENEQLRQAQRKGLSLKVSQKGAVSLYGLGRFPVTLYKEQWEKLLGFSESIQAFLSDHGSELKIKERDSADS